MALRNALLAENRTVRRAVSTEDIKARWPTGMMRAASCGTANAEDMATRPSFSSPIRKPSGPLRDPAMQPTGIPVTGANDGAAVIRRRRAGVRRDAAGQIGQPRSGIGRPISRRDAKPEGFSAGQARITSPPML